MVLCSIQPHLVASSTIQYFGLIVVDYYYYTLDVTELKACIVPIGFMFTQPRLV